MLFISIESNSCIVLLSCSLLHRHSKGVGGKLKKGIILLLSFNDLNVSPSFLHLLVIRHLVPEKVHLFKCIYFNSFTCFLFILENQTNNKLPWWQKPFPPRQLNKCESLNFSSFWWFNTHKSLKRQRIS